MAILMPHTHNTGVLHQLALLPGTLGHPIIHMLPLEFIHLDAYGNSYVKLLSNDPTKTAVLFLTLANNYYIPLMEQVQAEAITHNQAATTSPMGQPVIRGLRSIPVL